VTGEDSGAEPLLQIPEKSQPSPPRDCKAGHRKPSTALSFIYKFSSGRTLARNAAKPGDRRGPQSRLVSFFRIALTKPEKEPCETAFNSRA
jgi:hypothetical protein